MTRLSKRLSILETKTSGPRAVHLVMLEDGETEAGAIARAKRTMPIGEDDDLIVISFVSPKVAAA
jgi:hypothetical protein